MSTVDMENLKAPFTYFGGKRNAAPMVWEALGDVGAYIEPFAGSAAVLLRRPRFTGRRAETINDSSGLLINAWRAIRLNPSEVARWAAWPVSEVDLHARLAFVNEIDTDDFVSWLEGDPEACDTKTAGYWLYATSASLIMKPGPWRVIDDRLVKGKPGSGISRAIPTLASTQGIFRELPHRSSPDPDDFKDNLATYMQTLASRLSTVRIICGDWRRVVAPSVLNYRLQRPGTGIFLDPPYDVYGDIYGAPSQGISRDVREWCMTAPSEHRIVLAGYENDYDELLNYGWSVIQGKAGQGNGFNKNPTSGHRERLWLSPACMTPESGDLDNALDLWGTA